MKKTRILGLLLVSFLMFSGCSKDDDDDTQIVTVSGTQWETIYAKFSMTANGSNVVVELKTKAELVEADEYQTAEFRADGTFYVDNASMGTWSQSGNTVTVTNLDNSEYDAVLNGNVIEVELTETYEGMTVSSIYRYGLLN